MFRSLSLLEWDWVILGNQRNSNRNSTGTVETRCGFPVDPVARRPDGSYDIEAAIALFVGFTINRFRAEGDEDVVVLVVLLLVVGA